MPGKLHSPPVMLLAETDWSAWRSVNLYSRGGQTITASATADVYEDLLQALCSYTSQSGRSLSDDAQAGWNASGAAASVITVGIDEHDRVFIHSTAVAFTAYDQTGAYGLPTAPTAAVLTGGTASYGPGWVLRGTSDWTRGRFRFGSSANYLWITPAAALQYVAPSANGAVSSLPILLRDSSIGDGDAAFVTDCLESWDNSAVDNVTRRIRWGIDDDGRVFVTRINGTHNALSWLSTGFRDALGFTGLETEVATGTIRTLTATYEPLHGLLCAGLVRCHPWGEDQTELLDLRGGGIATQDFGFWRGWDVDVYLRGPALGHDDVTTGDVTRHFRDRFLPVARRGHGLNLYRHWGDTRRARAWREVTALTLAYDVTHTSERDGTRGRLRCLREDDTGRRGARYDGQPETRQTVGFSLRERA